MLTIPPLFRRRSYFILSFAPSLPLLIHSLPFRLSAFASSPKRPLHDLQRLTYRPRCAHLQ